MPPLLKSKPRAYSERNLHRLQNKHGIIASTKEGESSESSYKRGPSRGVQNGLYSDSDPKFESDDSAFLTPYIRNGDQQSNSGIYELFLYIYTGTSEACSAERVLGSARQNSCFMFGEFWQALPSARSVEHVSDDLFDRKNQHSER